MQRRELEVYDAEMTCEVTQIENRHPDEPRDELAYSEARGSDALTGRSALRDV